MPLHGSLSNISRFSIATYYAKRPLTKTQTRLYKRSEIKSRRKDYSKACLYHNENLFWTEIFSWVHSCWKLCCRYVNTGQSNSHMRYFYQLARQRNITLFKLNFGTDQNMLVCLCVL
jgi:hypothetical protein